MPYITTVTGMTQKSIYQLLSFLLFGILLSTNTLYAQQRKVQVTQKRTSEAKHEKVRRGYEPLFGKKHAHYETISNELRNAAFYLVCGHG